MKKNEKILKSHEAAYVCSHIFENTRPILYVCKADGEWQFLCGEQHEVDEIPRVVGVGHLFERDSSLFEIANLKDNWEAERETIDEKWVKKSCEHPSK